MARLWTSGFELQSVATGVEVKTNGVGLAGSISTTTFRSGAASLRIAPTASFSWINQQVKATADNTQLFVRVYFNLNTAPVTGTAEIFSVANTTAVTRSIIVRYNSTGTKFECVDSVGTVIGSSGVVTTGVWYRIELDVTGSTTVGVVKGYLDGVQFANSSVANVVAFDGVYIGAAFNSSTYIGFFDDIAINDSTGLSQTGLPGSGKVVRLFPNGTGLFSQFPTQTGGTAGVANNYTRIDEVIPDDATTFNGSNTLNQEDCFALAPSGIGASDTVNVTHVGGRFRNNVADAVTGIAFELLLNGNGPLSSTIIPNSVTWKTNSTGLNSSYPLTIYQSYTQSQLDNNIQIGYSLVAGGTNRVDVTNVWAYIDYTPALDISLTGADTTVISESVNIVIQGGGGTKTINVSDTTVITEAKTIETFNLIQVSDTTVVTEALIDFPDTTYVKEFVSLSISSTFSTSDTTVMSESVSLFITTLFFSVSDTTTMSEARSLSELDYVNESETTVVSENVTILIPILVPSVNDTTTISESVNLQITSNLNVSDTTTITESVNLSKTSYINVSDTTNISESNTMNMSVSISVSDTTNMSDTALVSVVTGSNLGVTVSDQTVMSENVSIRIPILITNVFETTVISENILMAGILYYNSGDTTVVSEIVFITVFNNVNVSDTTVITELVTMRIISFVSVSDTTVITDSITMSGNLPISVSDTTVVSENKTVEIVGLKVSVSDTTLVSETIIFSGQRFINVSDTTTITDSPRILVFVFHRIKYANIVVYLKDQLRFIIRK